MVTVIEKYTESIRVLFWDLKIIRKISRRVHRELVQAVKIEELQRVDTRRKIYLI